MTVPESLSLNVKGLPAPQGSKKLLPTKAGPRMVESSGQRLKAWRAAIVADARAGWGERAPMTGPVALDVLFLLKKAKSSKLDHPTSRPDLDKLLRAVGDALVDAGVISDDSAIVSVHGVKKWALTDPGAHIFLRQTSPAS